MAESTPRRPSRAGAFFAWAAIAGFSAIHAGAVWISMGGWDAISNAWPPAVHDHPTYFHSALVTPHFLRQSWTTAGYDPAFMAGYPKSIIFPASSTLWEVVFLLAGPSKPALTYKIGILIFVSSLPWLVAISGTIWRLGNGATAVGVAWYLIYLWNDFPITYALFGMIPYQLAIPLGLVTAAALARYLDRGGLGWWLAASSLLAMVVLVHFTSVLILAPAAASALLVSWRNSNRNRRLIGLAMIAAFAIAVNAFWWWPGPWLASTKGASDFVFAEKTPVWIRLSRIVGKEPRIQLTLWLLGPVGLGVLWRRNRPAAASLAGFAGAGFAWGYLSGASRALDFLQLGRHTYALYSAMAMGAGVGVSAFVGRIGRRSRVFGAMMAVFLVLVVIVEFWVPAIRVLRSSVFAPRPMLTSKPTPQLLWVVNRIKAHVKPGERLLYEEGGFGIDGLDDPYRTGRYSGLLPHLTGVEVLGGPYLHAALKTNFTQFGEAKLFEKENWTEADFRRHARLYRPSAILCWTPHSRQFCREHPELITIKEDDRTILIGRVKGFEGATIRGKAEVIAEPGRLRVRAMSGELDGLVVLRYHFVPCLRSRPPVPLVPVMLEDDPVPFLGLRPTAGEVTIEMGFPP